LIPINPRRTKIKKTEKNQTQVQKDQDDQDRKKKSKNAPMKADNRRVQEINHINNLLQFHL